MTMATSGAELDGVLSATGGGVLVRVKVLAGSSRTKVAGVLGDRLKVAVSAAAEGGKANRAVCELLARVVGVAKRDTVVATGKAQPLKTVKIMGAKLCDVTKRLGEAVSRGG